MNKYAEFSKAGSAKRSMYRRIHKAGAPACIRKRAHESQEAAADWLAKRGHSGKPYRCTYCHQWHATTKGAK